MIYLIFYPLVFVVFRLLIRLLGRLRSAGEEHVPSSGPVIYCPNHVSDSDPVVLFVTVPRRTWYLGKSELFEIRIMGRFFANFRGIPIKRDSADRRALRVAEAVLRRGEPLTIFPEGRCSQTGRLRRIQPGAALLAVRTGAPIVPVGLCYTNELLPYGSYVPRITRHPVQVTFGEPIWPTSYGSLKHGEAIAAITEKLGIEIARLSGQLPPQGEKPDQILA